jgi:hypothetical protein
MDAVRVIGRRSGVVPFHTAASRMAALVRLAEDLFALPEASDGERFRLDADLARRATKLTERFRQAAPPPPAD